MSARQLLVGTLGTFAVAGMFACKFPYPADVRDDDASSDAAGHDAEVPPTWAILAVHASPAAPATEPTRLYRQDVGGRYVSSWVSNEADFGTSAAVADVDDDGDLDFVVGAGTVFDAGRNRLYRSEGGTPGLAWAAGEAFDTSGLALGDVDGDGDPDLVIADTGGVFLARNSGGAPANRVQLVVDGALGLDLGDVDRDGDVDMVVAHAAGTSIYTNDGAGNFQRRAWDGPADPVSVSLGDYDADGDLDLAVGKTRGFTIYRAEGTTMVRAFDASELQPSFTARTRVAWIDHDGDRDLDLVVGHCTRFINALCSAAPVVIYQNLGGTFALGWTAPRVEKSTSVAVGDFDNDGRPDLIVGSDGAPLHLYRNAGGGTFADAWTSVENEHTTAVAWIRLD